MSHFTKALEEEIEDVSDREPIETLLRSFAEKIRQAVAEDDVEWANGNKVTTQDQKPEMSEGEMLGYNQALTDFITHKREQLNKE